MAFLFKIIFFIYGKNLGFKIKILKFVWDLKFYQAECKRHSWKENPVKSQQGKSTLLRSCQHLPRPLRLSDQGRCQLPAMSCTRYSNLLGHSLLCSLLAVVALSTPPPVSSPTHLLYVLKVQTLSYVYLSCYKYWAICLFFIYWRNKQLWLNCQLNLMITLHRAESNALCSLFSSLQVLYFSDWSMIVKIIVCIFSPTSICVMTEQYFCILACVICEFMKNGFNAHPKIKTLFKVWNTFFVYDKWV